MSLFEGLSTANSGLAAAQLAINVSGQNITNADTEGYSRKRVDQSAAYRPDATYGQFGYGVAVDAVTRVRDAFIDSQVIRETTGKGYYSQLSSSHQYIEGIFNETGDYGLSTLLTNFWSSWSDVANDPSDPSAREALVAKSESLAGQFQYLANSLDAYQMDLDNQIGAQVDKINELTAEISKCNKVISNVESDSTRNANDTRDQRDQLLSELSAIVDVEYFEEKNGALTVTSNGVMLVSPSDQYDLALRRNSLTEEDGNTYESVEISLADYATVYAPSDGALKAMMVARDQVVPEYESYLNAMANTIVSSVNELHQTGYNLSGLTGVNFFDPSGTTARTMSLSQAVKDDVGNIAAAKGGNAQQVSIGTATAPFNTAATSVNLTDSTADARFNSQYRHILSESLSISVVNSATTPPTLTKLEEGVGNDYTVDYELGVINFNVPVSGVDMVIDFKYNDAGFSGEGNGATALAISQISDRNLLQNNVFGEDTFTIDEYYARMMTRLGSSSQEVEGALETRTDALTELKTLQSGVSGVSLDEEMADLMQYQYSYQASARLLSTIDEMLQVLLNV